MISPFITGGRIDGQPNERGLMVLTKVDLKGLQRGTFITVPVPINSKGAIDYTGGRCASRTATVATDSLAFRCWINYPSSPGKYRIRTELYRLNNPSGFSYPVRPVNGELIDFSSTATVEITEKS